MRKYLWCETSNGRNASLKKSGRGLTWWMGQTMVANHLGGTHFVVHSSCIRVLGLSTRRKQTGLHVRKYLLLSPLVKFLALEPWIGVWVGVNEFISDGKRWIFRFIGLYVPPWRSSFGSVQTPGASAGEQGSPPDRSPRVRETIHSLKFESD